MYGLLAFANKNMLRVNREIRKKTQFPHYYVQNYALPPFDAAKGVYTIPVDKIVSPHGFGYGPQGWHFYTEMLKEHIADPDRPYAQSILKKYYDTFQPTTVRDIIDYKGELNIPVLGRLPALLIRDFWRLDGSVEEILASVRDEETQLYGPISEFYGEEQHIRCVNAYRLIRKHGYIPDRFEDGYLSGYFLKHGNDFRYIVMGGKHRLAALGVLGYETVKVTCPYNLKILDVDMIENWPTVRSGLFTPTEIRPVFDRFFDEDGTSFAAHYNLSFRL